MSIYLDTNIFLNVIYKEQRFRSESPELLLKVHGEQVAAITSAVTLLEVILDMADSGFPDQVEAAVAAIEDLRGLGVVPLGKAMVKTAAEHVLEDRITIHDSYRLATALHSGASLFVTRDAGLAKKIAKYMEVGRQEV